MSIKNKIITLCVGIAVVAAVASAWSLHTTTGTISINGTDLQVRIAEHALAQSKGLGGYTPESLGADGMLFVFPNAETRTFWMKGMKMDLDIVWISAGKIVAIDRNVQAPFSRADEPERVTSGPLPVDAVLELPAGGVETFGLVEGMEVVMPQ